MADLIALILNLGVPLAMIAVALVSGRIIENRHYRSIREREARLLRLPAIPSRSWDDAREVAEARMVTGSVVVSSVNWGA